MTLEELQEQHPELHRQVLAAGQAQERERIKAIEEMALPGHGELLAKAKFDTCITASDFAMEQIKAEKETKARVSAQRVIDASVVNTVAAAPPDGEGGSEVVGQIAESITARNKRAGGVV